MSNHQNNQTPGWLIYAVASFSGITLGLTLVFIAWNSVLDENKRDFIFEYFKIREAVTHSVQVSNDLINSFATAIDENEIIEDQIFQTTAKEILDQQAFVEGILYSSLLNSNNNSISNIRLKADNYRFRDPHLSMNGYDISDDENYESILKSLFLNERTDTVVSVMNLESGTYYVLFKAVLNKGYSAVGNTNSGESIRGILSFWISPRKLIGNFEIPDTMTIDLHSESSNLSGRKLIFNNIPSADIRNSFLVSRLSEKSSILLPSYSVKLSVSKDISWQDVNHEMILYIALLLGLGITLLLIALVRAKDIHEKILIERNIAIELKVEEQTKELALARDEALEGSRMKSDFLTSMSHEIRTPLTAIIGMAELLSETKLSNDQLKYVKVFSKAGDTLLNLVNDILDLSKIEAEQLVLEDISFDLRDVVEEAVEIYAIKAAENHVELISRIDPDIDIKRNGDPAHLMQIILNLISNAIKFTEDGYIILRVCNSGPDELLFSVSDTGVGIPEEKQQSIFASFTQADSSTTRKYGGTGLGLTISKRLVEMMKGRIWVESESGAGSIFSFTVTLPVNKSATRNDLHLDGFLKDKTVLVVDSNEHNRIMICNILSAFGAENLESEADLPLNELSGNGKQKYQYIFLDYKTLRKCSDAEMDKFRQSRQLDSASVIIAMLGPVSLHQKIRKVNEFELDGYLTKPIKQSELLHVFSDKAEQVREGIASNKQADSVEDETSVDSKRILLVEDNEDNRMLVKTYLKKFPYIIDEAENGKIAVDLYRKNIYNLILMDVQMPVMDGHEATRAMRIIEAESGRTSTPIIALTAHAIKEEIDKCMEAGCDTHVGKPIKKSTLLSVIENYVT